MRIDYEMKMNTLVPLFAWEVVSRYVINPFNSCKVIDYLKEHYGRKRPKIDWCTIKELTSSPEIVKPRMRMVNLDTGAGSDNGKLYYFRLETSFTIENDDYKIEQEGFIWVSEIMSQVLEIKLKMFKQGVEEAVVEVN